MSRGTWSTWSATRPGPAARRCAGWPPRCSPRRPCCWARAPRHRRVPPPDGPARAAGGHRQAPAGRVPQAHRPRRGRPDRLHHGLGPVVVPVNFAVMADSIVIRTGRGTLIQAHAYDQVAFEVDHLDEAMRQGWSVLVSGPAHQVLQPAELNGLRQPPRSGPGPAASARSTCASSPSGSPAAGSKPSTAQDSRAAARPP